MKKFSNIIFALLVGLTVAAVVFAWTNPPGNPPTGAGAFGSLGGAPQNSVYVDTTGNVGIGTGTAIPGAKLEINGQIKIYNSGVGVGKVLTSDASGLASWQTLSASSWAVGGNDIYNVNVGNVGIGTTGPGAKLMLSSWDGSTVPAGYNNPLLILTGGMAGNNTQGHSIEFRVNAGGLYPISRIVSTMTDGSGGELQFHTTANYSTTYPTAAMTINDNGNVGIGTTTPGSILTVLGTSTSPLFNVMSSSSVSALFVSTTGNVGIGTAEPGAKLEVAGQIKITGGLPGNGRFLTSDPNGLATWRSLSSSVWQKRVTGECPANNSIRVIKEDGTVDCESDTDTVGITSLIPDYNSVKTCGSGNIQATATCSSGYVRTGCSGYFNFICLDEDRMCGFRGAFPGPNSGDCTASAYGRGDDYCVEAYVYCIKGN